MKTLLNKEKFLENFELPEGVTFEGLFALFPIIKWVTASGSKGELEMWFGSAPDLGHGKWLGWRNPVPGVKFVGEDWKQSLIKIRDC